MIITELKFVEDFNNRSAGYGHVVNIQRSRAGATPYNPSVNIWTNDQRSKFWIALYHWSRPGETNDERDEVWPHLDAATAQCLLNELLPEG